MLIRSATAVVAAFSLAACGTGGDEALDTLPPTQATDFVVQEISTTTSTTSTTVPFVSTELSLPASGTIPPSTTSVVTSDGTYTIQAGDSLAGIARKTGTTVDAIIAANGWTDGAKHLLLPGDTIRVRPAGSGGNTGGSSTTTAGGGNSGSGCSYTIKPGDNPSSVARQFGITVAELTAANPGGVMTTFLVGATLKIPANGNC